MWLRRKENKEKCMGKNVLILKLPESRDSVWNANVLQIIIQKRLRKWVDECTCAQILAIISSCCQLFLCSVNSAEWQFQAFEKKNAVCLYTCYDVGDNYFWNIFSCYNPKCVSYKNQPFLFLFCFELPTIPGTTSSLTDPRVYGYTHTILIRIFSVSHSYI